MDKISHVNGQFVKRKGIFGQYYRSVRFNNREVTIDNLLEYTRVCMCSPFNPNSEKLRIGKGSGEVIKEWIFKDEVEAVDFIEKNIAL